MPRKKVTNRVMLPQPVGHYIYAYLRTKSDVPYYIGQGSRPDRMTAKHSVRIPSDRSRIRVVMEGLSLEEANSWEKFWIAAYGRKIDGGVLMNKELGGDNSPVAEETKAQISETVSALYAAGVYENLNAEESVRKRSFARAANKAAQYEIPEEIYVAMPTWVREQCKAWLDANPDKSFHDWCLLETRSEKAANKYGLRQEDWDSLDRKQRNALKEFMVRWPGRDPYEYLNGLRGKHGPKAKINRDEVVALRESGMKVGEIAKKLGCSQPYISRILSGKRQPQRQYAA